MSQRWAAAKRRNSGSDPAPKLSVVIPVYNVERYLAECLDSLLAQTFTDFEAVVVIDGATDSSADIAQAYASRDPRITLRPQPQAGLGAARNAGVRWAGGEYLAFLDSDDLLPVDAYAVMMESIERTGSDLVVGSLTRGTQAGPSSLRLMRKNHERRRERATLVDQPLILADVFAVNKLYRRSFWDAAGLSFPTMRYEDQPTLTRALVAARTFDVIPETVYHWRNRDDGSSISQGRSTYEDLVDRLESKRMATEVVATVGRPEVEHVWYGDILPVDMVEYFKAVPGCSESYWSLVQAAVTEFWSADRIPFEETSVPVHQRYMGWLVTQGRREELEAVVDFVAQGGGEYPVELHGDRVVALLPGADAHRDLPPACYELRDDELQWSSRLVQARWQQGVVHLSGFAAIRNAPGVGAETELTAHLVGTSASGADVEVDVALQQGLPSPVARHRESPNRSHEGSGFTTSIDVGSLSVSHPDVKTWRLVLARRVGGIQRSGPAVVGEGPRVDLRWHPLHTGAEATLQARLMRVDGHAALRVRPAVTTATSSDPGSHSAPAPATTVKDSHRSQGSTWRWRKSP